MTDLRVLTAKAALNKMFKGNHFSICPIRELADMFCIRPDPEAMSILAPLHCVDYKDMPQELHDALPDLVKQALSGTPIFQFEVKRGPDLATIKTIGVIADKEAKPSFFGRFFGHRPH